MDGQARALNVHSGWRILNVNGHTDCQKIINGIEKRKSKMDQNENENGNDDLDFDFDGPLIIDFQPIFN